MSERFMRQLEGSTEISTKSQQTNRWISANLQHKICTTTRPDSTLTCMAVCTKKVGVQSDGIFSD
jgi:hypothetical protein